MFSLTNRKYRSPSDYIDISFISIMTFLLTIQLVMASGYNDVATKEIRQNNIKYLFVTENDTFVHGEKAKSLVITDSKTNESNVYDVFSNYSVVTQTGTTSDFITNEITTTSYMPKWYESLFGKKKTETKKEYKYTLLRSK